MRITKKKVLSSIDRKNYLKNVDYLKKILSNQKFITYKNWIRKYTRKNFYFFFTKLFGDTIKVINNNSQNLITYIRIKKHYFSFLTKELIKNFLFSKFFIISNQFKKDITNLDFNKLKKKITITQKKNIRLVVFKKGINHPLSFNIKKIDIILLLKLLKTINKKKLFEIKKRNASYIFIDNFISFFSYFDFFSKDLLDTLKNTQSKSKVKKLKKYSLILPYIKNKAQISDRLLKEKVSLNQNIFLKIKKKLAYFYSLFVILTTYISKLFFYSKNPRLYLLTNKIYHFFRKDLIKALKRQKLFVSPNVLFFMLTNNLKNFCLFKNIKDTSKIDLKINDLKSSLSYYIETNKKEEKVKPNQYYFYHLLKNRLSQIKFNNFNKFNLLMKTISLFRYLLLKKILKIKINKEISKKFIQDLIIFNNYRI